jgi:hypothetical protein
MAYRPCYPGSIRRRGVDKRGSTVWEQHDRYFRSRGEFRSPVDMFDIQLLRMIKAWRDTEDEVILMGDFNDNVYTGALALALGGDDYLLTEQYNKLFGEDAPFSHISGQVPISAVFATPGVDCGAAFIAPHKLGVGDHRVHVFDFSAESLLGLQAPASRSGKTRKLQCRIEYARVNYTRVLLQLTTRHRMYKKANILSDSVDYLSEAEFLLLYNKWDNEMTQLMHAAEDKCRKIRNNYIPYSPIVGCYIKRLHIFR